MLLSEEGELVMGTLLDTAWGMINGLFLNKKRQMNKSQKVSRSLTFLHGGLNAIVC